MGEVRPQLKFLEELDRLEKKRHEEAEREVLLRAARVGVSLVPGRVYVVDHCRDSSDCIVQVSVSKVDSCRVTGENLTENYVNKYVLSRFIMNAVF